MEVVQHPLIELPYQRYFIKGFNEWREAIQQITLKLIYQRYFIKGDSSL